MSVAIPHPAQITHPRRTYQKKLEPHPTPLSHLPQATSVFLAASWGLYLVSGLVLWLYFDLPQGGCLEPVFLLTEKQWRWIHPVSGLAAVLATLYCPPFFVYRR